MSIDPGHEYREALDGIFQGLEPGWSVRRQADRNLAWFFVAPEAAILPNQGWKLHISAAATEGSRLAHAVLPYLIDRGLSFKIPADARGLALINSGLAGRTQLGKIVTVYPRSDAELAEIAGPLDCLWPRTAGPAIRSDLPLRDGGAVFLRYGVFSPAYWIVDHLGQRTAALLLPDGSLVEDARSEDGAQPGWIPPPPVPCARPRSYDLSTRFRIGDHEFLPVVLLSDSARAQTFLALDLADAGTAVIKSVRRGVGGDLRGATAADAIRHEYATMRSLADWPGLAPAPIGYADGDPALLAMEDVSGPTLAEIPRAQQILLLPRLAEEIARLHAAGYVHRDIKLSNALVVGEDVRLIDFELAARAGESGVVEAGTRAYMPPGEFDGVARPSADLYALGAAIAHAFLGRDPAGLPGETRRMIGLLRLAGAAQVAPTVRDLLAEDQARRPSAAEVALRLRKAVPETPSPIGDGKQDLESSRPAPRAEQAAGIRWCRRAAHEAGRASRLFRRPLSGGHGWESAHFNDGTPSEGINVGAAGAILGLVTLDQALERQDFAEDIAGGAGWLAGNTPSSAAHGLFTGNAGVAVALTVAGLRLGNHVWIERARQRLEAACQAPANYDLFSGSAGVLWAACLMSEALQNAWPLALVADLGADLVGSVADHGGIPAWPVYKVGGAPKLGAAHGSAGIALALAEWGRRANKEEVSQLAAETFGLLYSRGRTDGGDLRMAVGDDDAEAPRQAWCHGSAGYLWCLLLALPEDSRLAGVVKWGVDAFASQNGVNSSVYCHGVAGELELWRMIGRMPQYRGLAEQRMRQAAARLRLLAERRDGLRVWSAETPDLVAPDLWVGFLGPASALALYAAGETRSILSPGWIAACARGRP